MSNPIYPGAQWNPGAAAGYAKGRTPMTTVVCHYTVGHDSTSIGLNGFFHWLVSRDGRIQQFCEADALAWHAGEWNGTGPGIEVEYLDEPTIFTDEARNACGGLVRWLADEWGVPLDYYDGPRVNQPHPGFISHRSLIQSQMHSDYWPAEDWAAMVAPPAAPSILELETMFTYTTPDQHNWLWSGGSPVVVSWDEVQWMSNVQNAGAVMVRYFGQQSWDFHSRLLASGAASVDTAALSAQIAAAVVAQLPDGATVTAEQIVDKLAERLEPKPV